MVKAFLCGVSQYTFCNNLPFCKNDTVMLAKVFEERLGIYDTNNNSVALKGEITNWEYVRELKKFCCNANEDDFIIIYFSGHGGTDDSEKHFLCATNTNYGIEETYIDTEYMIDIISKSPAKTKLIILDCCHADNKQGYTNNMSFKIEDAVDKFYQKGCAIFSSCKSTEQSYPYNSGEISAFTKFIYDALMDNYLVKDGYLYFNDFKNLVQVYANAWSKKYPDKVQTPILRSNIVGTITFSIIGAKTQQENVNQFKPIRNKDCDILDIKYGIKFNDENKLLKTYTAKIILKTRIQSGNLKENFESIIDTIKNIYLPPTNWQQKEVDKQDVNIIFIYIANDILDIDEGTYSYRVVWANRDKDKWLDLGSEAIKTNNYSYIKENMYEYLKEERLKNTISDEVLILCWDELLNVIITKTEELIDTYTQYIAEDIDRETLYKKAIEINSFLSELFLKADDMPFAIPNSVVKEFDKLSSMLCGSCRGLVGLYTNIINRTEQNQKACFEIELKNYYIDLNQWIQCRKELKL